MTASNQSYMCTYVPLSTSLGSSSSSSLAARHDRSAVVGVPGHGHLVEALVAQPGHGASATRPTELGAEHGLVGEMGLEMVSFLQHEE